MTRAASGGWRAPALAMLACAWGGNGFTPLVPAYVAETSLDQLGGSALFLVYVAGLVPGFLVGGALSDRLGRRPVVLASVVVAGVASVLLAFGAAVVPLLFVGRVLAGVGLGGAMTTGATWVRELSALHPEPGSDGRPDPHGPARRASLFLTAGFGAGPLVGGALAQFAPLPFVLPYVAHLVVTVIALVRLRGVPETVAAGAVALERVPVFAARRDFRRLVAPAAPWVFGAMAVAFIVMPAEFAPQLGASAVIVTTGLTLCALITGFGTQQLVRRASGVEPQRLLVAGLVVACTGCAVAAGALAASDAGWAPAVWLLPVVALVMGGAYGLIMVAGLAATQRAADPRRTGAATARFYSLSYFGFLLPTAFGLLEAHLPREAVMLALLVVAAGCLTAVATARRPASA